MVTTRRSWKFVGQADAKKPKPLENTDYFATAKITKTRTSNVISNTFQNHNLIRRNIEAVTTRRSWKPFAQKARGFESLFLRHKNEHHPSWMVFIFISQSEGTNTRSQSETGSSHTAGTEQTSRHKVSAVSASRGDVRFNSYCAERFLQTSPRAAYPSYKPSFKRKKFGLVLFCFLH